LKSNQIPNLQFIHDHEEVDMDNRWFDIALKEHFWIRRRWNVIKKIIAKQKINNLGKIADVGCGIGTQTNIIQDFAKTVVDGFDLNKNALVEAARTYQNSNFYCMDILRVDNSFVSKYDTVFILDIIEHLYDPTNFLKASRKLLKKSGICIINVPCCPSLYSAYDKKVGHHRRYSFDLLKKHIEISGLKIVSWTYWGAPLLPFLIVRKFLLRKTKDNTIDKGFRVSNFFLNELLFLISSFEPIRNHILGTSLTILAKVK
jgi:SAM-dependent methyltransferase